MKIKNIILYENISDFIMTLSREDAGDMIQGIISWNLGNDPKFNNPMLIGFWAGIKPNLENMVTNYNKKINAGEHGIKGGRPTKKVNSVETSSTPIEVKQSPAMAEVKTKAIESPIAKEELPTAKSSLQSVVNSMERINSFEETEAPIVTDEICDKAFEWREGSIGNYVDVIDFDLLKRKKVTSSRIEKFFQENNLSFTSNEKELEEKLYEIYPTLAL